MDIMSPLAHRYYINTTSPARLVVVIPPDMYTNGYAGVGWSFNVGLGNILVRSHPD